MEKWILRNPKHDFDKMSECLGVSKLLCRIMVNRGIIDITDAKSFLYPETSALYDGREMADMLKGVEIIKKKINDRSKIRIIGDYDVDGVISTYILYRALLRCGAQVDYAIPHRIIDGYGINNALIDNARSDRIDTIITCDNGISATEQIKYARDMGITVVVTDHHEVPFVESQPNERQQILPEADAVIDIKRADCCYPFKLLCGAGIAFKFIQVLYQELGIPDKEWGEFYEFVAIATVCDVVDLVGENRILVKKGLSVINQTKNPGLKALMKQTGIYGKELGVYHLGFIIGPCINASGRLDWAEKGLRLLLSTKNEEAEILALELSKLNNERKEMTIAGIEETVATIESSNLKEDKVLVVYKPDIHESIAGIIAGRIREKYNVPTFILTDAEKGVKGSGRSIEEYNMFEGLLKCKHLLNRFGGHPMAAGLSLDTENLELLRKQLNETSALTEEDLILKLYIDAHLPLSQINLKLAEELTLLEPFGKGNSKPLFAHKGILVTRASVLGEKRNVLKLRLLAEGRRYIDCIYFGDICQFDGYVSNKFGAEELAGLYEGVQGSVTLDMIFNIDINEYKGTRAVQLVMQYYR